MSRTKSMPMAPMSSRRPRNGLMYVAPALAESRAWVAEKQSVWLTRMPLPLRYFTAFSPSLVSGHFTTALGAIWDSSSPSLATPSLISATFAVSRKIFMCVPPVCSRPFDDHSRARSHALELSRVAGDASDHVDGARGADLVAVARRGRTEEDAERVARRPVAQVSQLDHRLRPFFRFV